MNFFVRFKFYLILMLQVLFLVSSCVPASKTKIAENFFAGITLSLSHSTLTVSNSQVATSTSITVTLSLKDQNGAAYISSSPVVTFSNSGGTSVGTLGTVTNHNNGTYTASFTGVTPGTPTTIHAQVDGREITSTLPTVQVTTGNYSLAHSSISVSSASVTSGSTVTVTLTSKDASNSQLPDGGLTVAFANSGGTSTGSFSAVTDNHDGTYSATFTGVTSGTATSLTATIGGAAVSSASPTVTVNFGAATKLSFVQGPSNTASGSTISPDVTVRALDTNNNVVTSYATDIVMAIHTNPASGTLSGTTTKTPSSGVSTFNDLSINYYGTGYKLTATSGALTAAVSSAFNITATALTYDLPFTSVTTPAYTTLYTSSSWSLMDFVSDLVRLTPTVQTDTAATTGTMDAGTASGVVIGTLADGTSTGLKLGSGGGCNGAATNCSELDSSWTPQWASLVSYWKMNNDWNDSKGSNNGTGINGATFSSSSKMNTHSGLFDGSDDKVDVGNPANLQLAGSFSIGAWVNVTAFNNFDGILCKGYGGAGGYSLHIRGGLDLWFEIDNYATRIIHNPTTLKLTALVWNYVTATYDGATMRVYINGIESGTGLANTLPPTATANNVIIGKCGGWGTWNGRLDDVAIWSTALTPAEIQTIYDRQKSAYSGTFTSRVMDAKSSSSWTNLSWIPTLPFMKELPDYVSSIQNETSTDYTSLVGSTGSTGANNLMNGIVGLWHLNESSWADVANEVKDDSGSGLHARAKNGAASSSNSLMGRAGYFDGTNDYLISTNNLGLSGDPEFTMAAWFKWTGSAWSANYPSIVGNDSTAIVGRGLSLTLNGGRPAIDFWNNRIRASTALSLNTWYHVAVTKTPGTLSANSKIYVNGALVASALENSDTAPNIIDAPAVIGRLDATRWFNGYIDEVAIWSRALHANEIKQLYQRGAARIKFQVRTCDDNACSGETWQGPDGTSGTYFSELNNNSTALTGAGDVKTTLPSMLFSNFTSPPSNNQYFQYRTILESDSATTALMPELKSVTVDPIHYDASAPSIYGNNGIAFSELNAFTETLGSGGCPSGIGYNLSLDKTTWKYWNGSNWVTSNNTSAQSNTASVIHSNTSTFGTQVGKGTVYVKAYLKSSGTSKCELDNLQIGGNR